MGITNFFLVYIEAIATLKRSYWLTRQIYLVSMLPLYAVLNQFKLRMPLWQVMLGSFKGFRLSYYSSVGIHHCCWNKHRAPIRTKKEIKVFLNKYMASPPVTPTPFLDRVFNLVACLT